MRATTQGFRPRLELLEDRLAPATVKDVAGILQISNQKGTLSVEVQATSGMVKVTDSGVSATFSGVGNLIQITGTNNAETTNFVGNTGFNGNVLITYGNGKDVVNLSGAAGTVTNGTVTLNAGLGNDTTSLSGRIGGNLTYLHSFGVNTVATSGATSVGGSASLVGAATVNVTAGNPLTVGGTLSITGQVNGSAPLAVTISDNLTVGQSLSVTGGSGTSSFVATGGTSALNVVNGNATFNFGLSSAGTLNLSPGVASAIGGNLYYSGSYGADTVTLGANLAVGGNATVNTGDGNDTITSAAGMTVGGNMNVTTGNGTETILLDGGVGGNLSINLGNGTDTATIGNAPGGVLYWKSGNGSDSVTLGDATNAAGETWNVYMQFGTASDTITLAGNGTLASPEQLSGFIDMGGPPGGNSFDPTNSLGAGTWVTGSPFTLQNV